MILNRQGLLSAAPIVNMTDRKHKYKGFSWGLTECGYDIRIKQRIVMFPGHRFALGSSIEEFNMPDFLMGRILNKSTWARLGIDASITTNIEPGWRGFLTIELHYMRMWPIVIPAGVGIAQVIFEYIETSAHYVGKYQDQADRPIEARR
jgi:dCTP deaminase